MLHTACIYVSDESPFLPKSQALSYFRKRDYIGGSHSEMGYVMGQQGLACECCTYYCTYEELQEYCVDPSDPADAWVAIDKRDVTAQRSKMSNTGFLTLHRGMYNGSPNPKSAKAIEVERLKSTDMTNLPKIYEQFDGKSDLYDEHHQVHTSNYSNMVIFKYGDTDRQSIVS